MQALAKNRISQYIGLTLGTFSAFLSHTWLVWLETMPMSVVTERP